LSVFVYVGVSIYFHPIFIMHQQKICKETNELDKISKTSSLK